MSRYHGTPCPRNWAFLSSAIMNISDFNIIKKEPPHDKSTWIEAIEIIRKNETGEIREKSTEMIWSEEENKPSTWIWEEGNFSCDCNRGLFFGEDQDECSEGKYSVNLKNPKTGEIFYREFD